MPAAARSKLSSSVSTWLGVFASPKHKNTYDFLVQVRNF